jgi:hypothetical protein
MNFAGIDPVESALVGVGVAAAGVVLLAGIIARLRSSGVSVRRRTELSPPAAPPGDDLLSPESQPQG